MQLDFHHTATYALSRIAGFSHAEARIIAYSAQYVDDAKNSGLIRFNNGDTYGHIASAHTVFPTSLREMGEFRDNLDNTLNADAWVPFHFLPGNFGKPAGEGAEEDMVRRFVCTADSPIAADMCRACVENSCNANGLHRLGITTHVFADTWAHCDFVGLDHPINRIRGLIHDEPRLHALGEDLKSRAIAALPVGHGMALALPDWPFLAWGYIDRDGQRKLRNNSERFLQASERIVAFHRAYRGEGGLPLMRPKDRDVLMEAFTGFKSEEEKDRHENWMALLGEGRFSFGALSTRELSEIRYIPKGRGSWKHLALGTESERDDPSAIFDWTPGFESSDWRLFHEALKQHRQQVLGNILPRFGLDPKSVEIRA